MSDDREEMQTWPISDFEDLTMALDEARDVVNAYEDGGYIVWALWNDKQNCSNVGKVTLFKIDIDGDISYEVELSS